MKKIIAFISIVVMCSVTLDSSAQASAKGNTENQAVLRDIEAIQYAGQGSLAFLAKNYTEAILFYTKALEQEMREPTLERDLWRVVVDNLGYSYYSTEDKHKAKEIFEYGLSKDDKFPMFYYNLACLYAEADDLDNAITKLRLAFKYKNNMIAGERFPNPAADSSFARYLKNEKFRRVLVDLTSNSDALTGNK